MGKKEFYQTKWIFTCFGIKMQNFKLKFNSFWKARIFMDNLTYFEMANIRWKFRSKKIRWKAEFPSFFLKKSFVGKLDTIFLEKFNFLLNNFHFHPFFLKMCLWLHLKISEKMGISEKKKWKFSSKFTRFFFLHEISQTKPKNFTENHYHDFIIQTTFFRSIKNQMFDQNVFVLQKIHSK